MNSAEKKRFEKAGWKVGTAAELLGLSEAEAAVVEAKLQLSDALRAVRKRQHLTQAALAERIGSTQARVAKVENRDPETSMDLQLKAIFAAEPSTRRDFQALIRKWSAAPAIPGPMRAKRARRAAGRRRSTRNG